MVDRGIAATVAAKDSIGTTQKGLGVGKLFITEYEPLSKDQLEEEQEPEKGSKVKKKKVEEEELRLYLAHKYQFPQTGRAAKA